MTRCSHLVWIHWHAPVRGLGRRLSLKRPFLTFLLWNIIWRRTQYFCQPTKSLSRQNHKDMLLLKLRWDKRLIDAWRNTQSWHIPNLQRLRDKQLQSLIKNHHLKILTSICWWTNTINQDKLNLINLNSRLFQLSHLPLTGVAFFKPSGSQKPKISQENVNILKIRSKRFSRRLKLDTPFD